MNNQIFSLLILFFVGFGISSGIPLHQESGVWGTLDGQPPKLMAHRGEKVLMPEHTVGSYEIASIENADYVEPDLVLTRDGHLVCFHDLTIRDGTDVSSHDEFAGRMRDSWTGELDGKNKTITNNWFIADFDLEELRTLRVTQKPSVGIRPQLFNELFQIPTFEEYLGVIHKLTYKQNRTIGVIPELKHPKFHNKDRTENYMEETLLSVLREYGYPIVQGDSPNCNYTNEIGTVFHFVCSNIVIQSFEFSALEYLKTKSNIELLMLADVSYLTHLTYEGLKEVAGVAQQFSIWKELMYTGVKAEIEFNDIEYDEDEIERLGGFIPAQDFVKEAHKLGLKMGLFTIYDSHEISHRGCTLKCDEPQDKRKEMFYYFEMGVDGLFVENVQEAIELRAEYDYLLKSQVLENKIESLESELEELRSSVSNLVPTRLSIFFVIIFVAISNLL